LSGIGDKINSYHGAMAKNSYGLLAGLQERLIVLKDLTESYGLCSSYAVFVLKKNRSLPKTIRT
jgi:hypothetical protein